MAALSQRKTVVVTSSNIAYDPVLHAFHQTWQVLCENVSAVHEGGTKTKLAELVGTHGVDVA